MAKFSCMVAASPRPTDSSKRRRSRTQTRNAVEKRPRPWGPSGRGPTQAELASRFHRVHRTWNACPWIRPLVEVMTQAILETVGIGNSSLLEGPPAAACIADDTRGSATTWRTYQNSKISRLRASSGTSAEARRSSDLWRRHRPTCTCCRCRNVLVRGPGLSPHLVCPVGLHPPLWRRRTSPAGTRVPRRGDDRSSCALGHTGGPRGAA